MLRRESVAFYTCRQDFLRKLKVGRNNYYINEPLYRNLTGETQPSNET